MQGVTNGGGVLAPDQIVTGDFSRDGGHAATRELISRGLRATAVVALNDFMAVGALTALRNAGLRVPEDVSLSGFDDIPLLSDLTPALTTVRLPLADLGARAAAMALAPAVKPRVEQIAAQVIIRDSAAPPHAR